MTHAAKPLHLYEPGDIVLVYHKDATTLFGYTPEQWHRAVILERGESRGFASGVYYDIWYLPGEAHNPQYGTRLDASHISGIVVTEQAE